MQARGAAQTASARQRALSAQPGGTTRRRRSQARPTQRGPSLKRQCHASGFCPDGAFAQRPLRAADPEHRAGGRADAQGDPRRCVLSLRWPWRRVAAALRALRTPFRQGHSAHPPPPAARFTRPRSILGCPAVTTRIEVRDDPGARDRRRNPAPLLRRALQGRHRRRAARRAPRQRAARHRAGLAAPRGSAPRERGSARTLSGLHRADPLALPRPARHAPSRHAQGPGLHRLGAHAAPLRAADAARASPRIGSLRAHAQCAGRARGPPRPRGPSHRRGR